MSPEERASSASDRLLIVAGGKRTHYYAKDVSMAARCALAIRQAIAEAVAEAYDDAANKARDIGKTTDTTVMMRYGRDHEECVKDIINVLQWKAKAIRERSQEGGLPDVPVYKSFLDETPEETQARLRGADGDN